MRLGQGQHGSEAPSGAFAGREGVVGFANFLQLKGLYLRIKEMATGFGIGKFDR
jgi:hypothetical protein